MSLKAICPEIIFKNLVLNYNFLLSLSMHFSLVPLKCNRAGAGYAEYVCISEYFF